MKTWVSAAAIVVTGAMLWSVPALGQAKKGCDALKAGAPQKVEGQVVSVDANAGKITVKAADGKTHDFQISKEMVKDYKVGDRITAQLSDAANC
jgi:hypothetical protein